MINDHITESPQTCWERTDLVNVPDILKYSDTLDSATGIHFYQNNIGILIALIPYGFFNSAEALYQDYYHKPESLYLTQYAAAVQALNRQPAVCSPLADFEWIMPVLSAPFQVTPNDCCVPQAIKESREYVSLIDCSFIYTASRMISEFTNSICQQTSLSKYQRWQLAYYQRAIQSVEYPTYYLTNQKEITLYDQFYDVWKIDDSMKIIVSNINQTVALFTFISNYENNADNELFSSFLTFFGIVVGLEAIYNLFSVLFNETGYYFKLTFIVLIIGIVLIFLLAFIRKAFHHFQDKQEFLKKTGRKR